MIKIVYEKMEDYRKAIRELKIKRLFYNIEVSLASKEQNAYAAHMRVTAVSPDAQVHLTLLERIGDKVITSKEDNEVFQASISAHKDKFFDLVRETLPEVSTIAGVIVP